QEVDCSVLLPMDGAALKTAAISVKQANIPLVIFDRQIPDFAPSATVTGDNRGIGVRTAEYFNNYFPKGSTVLELMGDTSTVPFLRSDGFAETLNSNFQHIQVGYTDWQRERTKTMFKEWIRKQPAEVRRSVGGIYTHDDEIALGVLDVLDEYKEQGTIQKMFPNLKVIAGSSDSQEMYQRIQEEEDYTLISLSYLPNMIREAIRTGEHLMKGEPYEEMEIIPTELVTKKNVENYIKKTAK
ncbi:MAG: substrate-binding domain-containing protein, partial [Eubacteriales bacterium]|nr:substrate-binding domain-containing protein [Eubacteriales bacterium]